MEIGPMVPLTTSPDPMAARILAARLGSEGIVWQLRGHVDGPYPVGPVEVLVAADDLALARELLNLRPEPEAGVPDLIGDHAGSAPVDTRTSLGKSRWLAVVGVVVVALVGLGRLLVLVL